MRALWVACALVACGGSSSPPPVGTRIGPALTAAFGAMDHARAPWRCTAADGPKLATEELRVGAHAWKLAGDTVTLAGKAADRSITIGVIADAGGSAPTTLAALGRLRAQLEGADLVIALGGMGTTQPEIEGTLGALAERASWPLVALPGDLESVPAQTAAIQALRARGAVVLDGRLARRIELPGVTIATVPGAGAASRLVAEADGCTYEGADVSRLIGQLTARDGLRILATAEAPRISVDGEPAGVRVLTPGALHEVDLVLHGPAGNPVSRARTGTRDATATPLSPGTSDATTRLPGPRIPPSAGLLTVTGTSWRWRPLVDAS